MHYSNFILLGLLSAGACSSVLAQEVPNKSVTQTNTLGPTIVVEQKVSTIQAIKDLKHLTKNDLKVNANAAQPDAV
ncbi:MAG: VacJ family lipoprotein, partial [Acinetobacter sp.]